MTTDDTTNLNEAIISEELIEKFNFSSDSYKSDYYDTDSYEFTQKLCKMIAEAHFDLLKDYKKLLSDYRGLSRENNKNLVSLRKEIEKLNVKIDRIEKSRIIKRI